MANFPPRCDPESFLDMGTSIEETNAVGIADVGEHNIKAKQVRALLVTSIIEKPIRAW